MAKISSDSTFFIKRVFPILWFIFPGLFLAVSLWNPDGKVEPLQPILITFVLIVAGYLGFRYFVFDLMDEVHDNGESLMVKNGDQQDVIPLADIEKVRFSSSRPPRITLLLKKESKFGNSITFTPPPRMILFGPHPIVKDLNERLKVLRLS